MTNHPSMVYCVSVFVLLLASACATVSPRVDSQGRPQYEYVYNEPEETDDGWEASSLDTEGVDLEKIEALIRNILNGRFENIHSVLLVKNGKLVLEEYFVGYVNAAM